VSERQRCRDKGWVIGDVLLNRDAHGERRIVITGMGINVVLGIDASKEASINDRLEHPLWLEYVVKRIGKVHIPNEFTRGDYRRILDAVRRMKA
jgi:hypothetical protein